MRRVVYLGVLAIVFANAVYSEQELEKECDCSTLSTRVSSIEKNVADLWNYIYQLRNATEAHLRDLREGQRIMEQSYVHTSKYPDHHHHYHDDHKHDESESHDHHHQSESPGSSMHDDDHHGGSSHEHKSSHDDDEHHHHSGESHHDDDQHSDSHHGDQSADHHHSDSHHSDQSGDHHHSDSHHGDQSGDHHHSDSHHGDQSGDHHSGHNQHQGESSHDDYHQKPDSHHDSHHHHDHQDPHHSDHISHNQEGHHNHGDEQTGDDQQKEEVVEKVVAASRSSHHHHHKLPVPIRNQAKPVTKFPEVRDYKEYVFASCNVESNREIDPKLRQDVRGEITLWQKKTGGPLGIHVRVNGFNVGGHHGHHGHHAASQDPSSPAREPGHRHGFHIHNNGNLSQSCQSTGPHYNPRETTHGSPATETRHVGDLGNIECDNFGYTNIVFTDNIASLVGEESVLNRAMAIHANEDDYGKNPDNPESQLTGNAGPRIACCIIKQVDKPSIKAFRYVKRATEKVD